MKEYRVAYIKDTEEYARITYMSGATVKEIVEELTNEINSYYKQCDYITIFDVNNEEDISYFKVVTVDGKYKLMEMM